MRITDKEENNKMIIDSKKYNGKCQCGKEHKMDTELCVISSGCLKEFKAYADKCGLSGDCVAIYDENTYRATADRRPSVSKEIVLPPENLHADNRGVELALSEIPSGIGYLAAVGSGTVHDITRYCAHKLGINFVSCPTAASVDGFCSSVAAMTWNGFKKTFTAVAPILVLADLDVIVKSPFYLTKSGVGDMLGKYIALAEWRISNVLTGEYLCERIYDMTRAATDEIARCACRLKDGNTKAFEQLMYGLLMSGLAMQLLGNSRCASGAEHHISHLIEMRPSGLGESSNALHGEKVGVATLLVRREYERMRNKTDLVWNDYKAADSEYIKKFFGEHLSEQIINENAADTAAGITREMIEDKRNDIFEIIDKIPPENEMLNIYKSLGMKMSLEDIGISESKRDTLFEYSPLVRNRLTLMRLRRAIENI